MFLANDPRQFCQGLLRTRRHRLKFERRDESVITQNSMVFLRSDADLLPNRSRAFRLHEAGVSATGIVERLAKRRQSPIKGQPRRRVSAQIRSMAAPRVVVYRINQSGTQRIQMNVPNELQQIRIGLHEDRAVPSFEQMSRAIHLLVGRPGVLTRDEAHKVR